jgi:trigger factor
VRKEFPVQAVWGGQTQPRGAGGPVRDPRMVAEVCRTSFPTPSSLEYITLLKALSSGAICVRARKWEPMTDETRPEEPGAESPGAAVAAPEAEGDEKKSAKLNQKVDIRDTGPCKKHITVTVDRGDIDARLHEQYSKLVSESSVAGFRPGKAPRKLIEKRFQKEVGDQVKNEVLLASLEQLAEDHDIAPLNSPNINPNSIELPPNGPLVYEFEVEVRPQFELPNYRGLNLRRPTYTFTEKDAELEERRLLRSDAQVVPKPEGSKAVEGDIIVADVVIRAGDKVIGELKETVFQIDKQLAFKDGVAPKFGEQIQGSVAGDKRVVDVELSQQNVNSQLRGQTVQATFDVKDVKTLRLPEMTPEYLARYGVSTPAMLRELIIVILQRRLEYTQRQSAREQVIKQIAASSQWDLPQDLLERQAVKAMNRKQLEMQADGISEKEIQDRLRLLRQDILNSTALSLKEHFVLQKIAEVEKIDIDEDDINDEIERLANQQGESPRRLRARLEKEDMLESLVAEMYERKALDLILDSAIYEDQPLNQSVEAPNVSSVEAQAVPGQAQDAAPEPADGNPASPQ